jgi:hypothetical protein
MTALDLLSIGGVPPKIWKDEQRLPFQMLFVRDHPSLLTFQMTRSRSKVSSFIPFTSKIINLIYLTRDRYLKVVLLVKVKPNIYSMICAHNHRASL